jgi:hypothetical protein
MSLTKESQFHKCPNAPILDIYESQNSFGTPNFKGILSWKTITTSTPNNIQLNTDKTKKTRIATHQNPYISHHVPSHQP